MKFTRVKTTVMAGLMAASMLAPGMTAFAGDGDITAGALTLNKTVKVGANISLPATTYTFSLVQVDADGDKEGAQNADGTTQPLEINGTTEISIAKDALTTTGADLEYTAEFTTLTDKLNANGEYTFKLTETAPETTVTVDSPYGWTKDTNEYYLHVYKTSDGFTYIVSKDNEVTEVTKADGTTTVKAYKNKVSSDDFAFVNKYTKEGGSVPTPDPENPDGGDKTGALRVSKTVTGNASLSNAFTFTVTLENSSTSSIANDSEIPYTIGSGAEQKMKVTEKTVGSKKVYEGTIQLKNGEEAVFTKIEAGVKATVTEADDTTGNTSSTKVKASWNSAAYSEENEGKSATGTLGEKPSYVKFTNEYAKDTVITGVVTNIAPYVTLVVLAVAAVAAYMAMKSKVAR